jgi:integrase
MKTRQEEGASGRTINTEVGELSRAIGRPWSVLWPKVRKMEERHDVGRALSPGEETSILKASAEVRSPNLRTLVRLALLTGMRSGELTNLTWGQIDFDNRLLTVGEGQERSWNWPDHSTEQRPVPAACRPRGMVHREIRRGKARAIRVSIWFSPSFRRGPSHHRTQDRMDRDPQGCGRHLPVA